MCASSSGLLSVVVTLTLGFASLAVGAVTNKDSGDPAETGRGEPRGPADTRPVVRIVSLECGPGLAVPVHISVQSPKGILSYSVWSTWGGSDQATETFTPPLPKSIDKIATIRHFAPDTVDRKHQVGLKVMLQGTPEPIFAYAMEPNDRCPGHYLPPPAKK